VIKFNAIYIQIEKWETFITYNCCLYMQRSELLNKIVLKGFNEKTQKLNSQFMSNHK